MYNRTLKIALETAIKIKGLLFSTLTLGPQATSTHKILFYYKILSMNREHTEVLSNILNETMKVKRVERLFRASEHGFSAKAFH